MYRSFILAKHHKNDIIPDDQESRKSREIFRNGHDIYLIDKYIKYYIAVDLTEGYDKFLYYKNFKVSPHFIPTSNIIRIW